MSPAGSEHGKVADEVAYLLNVVVRRGKLGRVFAAESGFILDRDPDTVRAPDVAFVAEARIDETGIPKAFFPGAPNLAVEVVSPSDSAQEVHEKARYWIERGCQAVWVVWPDDQSVTVYRSLQDIQVLTADEKLTGEPVVPGFSVKVAELFAGLK